MKLAQMIMMCITGLTTFAWKFWNVDGKAAIFVVVAGISLIAVAFGIDFNL
jgi:hypothetical protein